jgi:hypothetical protein
MRPVFYVATFIAVMALAFWAYRENYATQHALREVSSLQRDITSLREALSIQHAEWAYLNRPDRLRDLAALNYDRLGLLPLEPEQFGQVDQTAYPPSSFPAALPDVSDPVDVIGTQETLP